MSERIVRTWIHIFAVVALAAGGCAVDGPTPAVHGDFGLSLFVRNETDRTVVVLVDGFEVGRFSAGERIKGRLVLVPTAPPNMVVVRTETGHVFGSFRSDTAGQFGVPGFVGNTRCGDVWVWLEHDITAEIAPNPLERQAPCD